MQITASFESIEEMRSFARQIAGEVNGEIRTEKPQQKTTKVQKQQEPEPQEESEPTQKEPESEQKLQKAEAEATEESGAAQEETAYTLEEVRAKLAELQKAGKRGEVKALLTSFGASKLSEIPASKYAVLMVKAGEL